MFEMRAFWIVVQLWFRTNIIMIPYYLILILHDIKIMLDNTFIELIILIASHHESICDNYSCCRHLGIPA